MLGHETAETLARANKTPADVRWVGLRDTQSKALMPQPVTRGSWEDFLALPDFDGECEPHLVVVGDDWWLARRDFGHEWGWELNTPRPGEPNGLSLSADDLRAH